MTSSNKPGAPVVRANIMICGTFDPVTLSRNMGVEPSLIWRQGDPWPTQARLRPDDGLVVRFEEKPSWDVVQELETALDYLVIHPQIVATVRAESHVGIIRLDVQISVDDSGPLFPGIILPPELIERIHKSGFSLNVDQIGIGDFAKSAN